MPDSSPPVGGRWPAPPSKVAAAPSGLKAPLTASAELLRKELEDRPLLWVGAGVSVAAGYPSTGEILRALAAKADGPLDLTAPFPRVVDAFVESRGKGALDEILHRLFQPRSSGDNSAARSTPPPPQKGLNPPGPEAFERGTASP